ncbi:MAG TPA: hypothetical protein VD790_01615 [Thermoleophilaceae bacterium]|nr:hypothetical protein [Thermoleophilaceae bacterium]
MRLWGAALLATFVIAGCGGGKTELRTITVRTDTARKEARFSYEQMQMQSRKTCAAVPRDVLSESFRAASEDGLGHAPGAEMSDNDVALLYAESLASEPIPLQQAAYDGCLAGLERGLP